MGYAENRGDYYRARYKIAPGKYGTVKDENGRTIKFRTKREAEKAANNEEAKVDAGKHRDPNLGSETFGEYVNRWYDALELAPSTMQNYRNNIQSHLLPFFGEHPLSAITKPMVATWESSERAFGCAAESIKTYRAILHTILSDAVEEGLIAANPATRRPRRGRRTGGRRARGPEKVHTSPLGALLVAERAAILTGRNDEFVKILLTAYTGMRWGEVLRLDQSHVHTGMVRVEQQLYELEDGTWVECPPKYDSYRDLDVPPFLSSLVADHMARVQPSACACHGALILFRGSQGQPGSRISRQQIAQEAGVGLATVSRALNHPALVAPHTHARVLAAVVKLGADRELTTSELEPHWERDKFRRMVFAPAATGQYPPKGKKDPQRPVCVLADSWPGTVIQGKYSASRAEVCWMPIAQGLTPHGLRHSHRTWMEDLGTRQVLMDERMGHFDGSVDARYRHVTQGMRDRLMEGLTNFWEESLAARAAMSPSSPVAALDALLHQRTVKIISQNSPKERFSQHAS